MIVVNNFYNDDLIRCTASKSSMQMSHLYIHDIVAFTDQQVYDA